MVNTNDNFEHDNTNTGLKLNRSFLNDDMDGLLMTVYHHMKRQGLQVKLETIVKFSEDGLLLRPSDGEPAQ